MKVKVKFIGKVNFTSDGVTYSPNAPYTIEKEFAEKFNTLFEVLETPKPERKIEEKPARTKRSNKTED